MRVLLLSRYDRLGASSRVRSLQYLPLLRAFGIEVDVAALFDDDYVRGLYAGCVPLRSVFWAYMRRIGRMIAGARYDLLWIEKEIFPWLPVWIERTLLPRRVPYLVDFDDAIFHRYDAHKHAFVRFLFGDKIDRVMAHAALVIVGNDYLSRRAVAAGAQCVEQLPTVVDLDRYSTAENAEVDTITIGWIGTPGTARYLDPILPALRDAARRCKVRFPAVGALGAAPVVPPIEPMPWSETTEVQSIQGFDIGIMPLPDTPFERGKCGYKLIQYMACGKPVIASPVGVNTAIVEHGVNGFLASTVYEWTNALGALCADKKMRREFGLRGRNKVESGYSLQQAAPRLANLLRQAAGRRS